MLARREVACRGQSPRCSTSTSDTSSPPSLLRFRHSDVCTTRARIAVPADTAPALPYLRSCRRTCSTCCPRARHGVCNRSRQPVQLAHRAPCGWTATSTASGSRRSELKSTAQEWDAAIRWLRLWPLQWSERASGRGIDRQSLLDLARPKHACPIVLSVMDTAYFFGLVRWRIECPTRRLRPWRRLGVASSWVMVIMSLYNPSVP